MVATRRWDVTTSRMNFGALLPPYQHVEQVEAAAEVNKHGAMTAPRPYRAGLGLPEAVVIRSDPGPSTVLPRRPTPPAEVSAAPPISTRPAKWDSLHEWTEWNINPTSHGPQQAKGPPVFVAGQGSYDELGRSRLDGFGVTVDEGKAKLRHEGVEDGPAVSDWYANLTRSASSTRPSSPKASVSNEASSSSTRSAPIALSEERPIVRVHRNEWFIRRALASQARDPQQSGTVQKPAPAPSAISHLLSDTPSTKPKPQQYRYALGPENKGYELLRDRLGWHGGGLGRPVGWDPASAGADVPEITPTPREGAESRPIEIDPNGNTVVDLTADSSDSDDYSEAEEDPQGSGRTAPIATTLKLDKLGLGHRRAQPRDHLESTKKKVTHSAREIREAQKRAKYAPRDGVELGKKGRMRWKQRDKQDREERARIADMLR